MSENAQDSKTQEIKDALVNEIIVAYQEAAIVFQKTTDVDTKDSLFAIKHGLDLMLRDLFPLSEQLDKIWEECKEKFSH